MQSLLVDINHWFFSKRRHIDAFAENDVRVEGWFKGELLCLFKKLKEDGVIDGFEREVPFGRRKIDFQITIGEQNHLCELKSLCISQNKGTPRNLNFYFRDDNLGLINDFKKLERANYSKKWVLGFVYPKPPLAVWRTAINRIPRGLNQWHCISRLNDYPDYVFISLWKR